MSQHSEAAVDAFEGLLDLAGETVSIDGEEYDGKVSVLTTDEILVAGGTAEAGGFRIMLRLADFPADPDEFVPVVARGRTLKLIHPITRNNGHLEIIAADPASQ